MQLIAQLNEASDVSLADLKKVLQKDPRVKQVFTKNLQLDEIKDPVEFVKTLRYHLLNNRNVLAFVGSIGNRTATPPRPGVAGSRSPGSQRLGAWDLSSIRKILPDHLTQQGVVDIQEFVSNLFRDVTSVTNLTITGDTMSTLWQWLSGAKGYRGDLSYHAVRELLTFPAVRPEGPVRLYKGLAFYESSLKEKDTGYGTMEVGEGLKFLRSVRQGKRVVDIDNAFATIWTRSKEQAQRDAFSDNSWEQKNPKIKGELGFVISVLAKPSDIVVDTDMLGPKVKHDPAVVVLKAGKYTSRIVHKWTPEGEVDPNEKPADAPTEVADSLMMFARIFKLPYPDPEFTSMDRGGDSPARKASFLELIKPEATAKITKAYDVLREFYNKFIKDVPESQMNSLAADPEYGKAALVAKELHEFMANTKPHPTMPDERYSASKGRKKYVPRHELTGQELWDGTTSFSAREAVGPMVSPVRYTDWNTSNKINDIASMAGLPRIKDAHRASGKVQQDQINKIIPAFCEFIGEPVPENRQAAAHLIADTIRTAERNADLLSDLWEVKRKLDALKD
jgi:hypothetical protein